jgi:Winged helix DNA-binding domain
LRKLAHDVGGIHAQVHSAAEFQAAVRIDGLAPAAMGRALYKSKSLVKTWMMRGTIHYLDPSDLPVWAAASATRRSWNKPYWQKAFGITSADVERAIEIIPRALNGRCLTREAIADEVHRLTKNNAVDELLRAGWGSILKIVAAEGLLCFGPNQGRNVTFTRPDQWLEQWRPPPPTEQAIEDVCRRYLSSHGPATREEFARWWGFSPPDASKVLGRLEDSLAKVDRQGDKAFLLEVDAAALQSAVEDDRVRMLPMFDAYTLSGLPHENVVPKKHKDRVLRKGAWVSQVVARGGRIVGVWTHESKSGKTSVEVRLFNKGAASKEEMLDALRPMTTFIGQNLSLSLA